MTSPKDFYPDGRCWIGTADAGEDRWQVSDGPAGSRSHSFDFGSAREALDFAKREGLSVTFEDDFEWGEDQPVPLQLYAWELRGGDDVKLVAAEDAEAAARVAMRVRVESLSMSPEEALAALAEDRLTEVDPDRLVQGDVEPWDGLGEFARLVGTA